MFTLKIQRHYLGVAFNAFFCQDVWMCVCQRNAFFCQDVCMSVCQRPATCAGAPNLFHLSRRRPSSHYHHITTPAGVLFDIPCCRLDHIARWIFPRNFSPVLCVLRLRLLSVMTDLFAYTTPTDMGSHIGSNQPQRPATTHTSQPPTPLSLLLRRSCFEE